MQFDYNLNIANAPHQPNLSHVGICASCYWTKTVASITVVSPCGAAEYVIIRQVEGLSLDLLIDQTTRMEYCMYVYHTILATKGLPLDAITNTRPNTSDDL